MAARTHVRMCKDPSPFDIKEFRKNNPPLKFTQVSVQFISCVDFSISSGIHVCVLDGNHRAEAGA